MIDSNNFINDLNTNQYLLFLNFIPFILQNFESDFMFYHTISEKLPKCLAKIECHSKKWNHHVNDR